MLAVYLAQSAADDDEVACGGVPGASSSGGGGAADRPLARWPRCAVRPRDAAFPAYKHAEQRELPRVQGPRPGPSPWRRSNARSLNSRAFLRAGPPRLHRFRAVRTCELTTACARWVARAWYSGLVSVRCARCMQ